LVRWRKYLSLATEEEAAEPTGRGHYSAADIPPDARVAIARIGAGLIGHGMTQANFRNLLKRQGYDVLNSLRAIGYVQSNEEGTLSQL
jgi:hypothetical protein